MSFIPEDFYFKKAKKEQYLARSVYKLEAILEKFPFLKKSLKNVFDCGASPGSWSQYLLRNYSCRITSLDLNPLGFKNPSLNFIQKDFLTIHHLQDLDQKEAFSLILSDMAPKTTGHKNVDHLKSLSLVEDLLLKKNILLEKGGHLVVKIFEGPELEFLLKKERQYFKSLSLYRPPAVRKESKEIYLIAKDYLFS